MLKAADLVETLKGKGPLHRLLRATDEAFAKLPKGTVEDLLKPENKKSCRFPHLPRGRRKSHGRRCGQADGGDNGPGLQGLIKVSDGKVTVDAANVVKTDIGCSNGVIHVIDAVILPK